MIGDQLEIDIEIPAIISDYHNIPITLNGTLRHANQTLQIDQLDLVSGSNRATATGIIDNEINLQWSLTADSINQILENAQGQLLATGEFSGELSNPALTSSISAQNLQWQSLQSNHLEAQINIEDWQSKKFTFDFQARDIVANELSITSINSRGSETTIRSELFSEPFSAVVKLVGAFEEESWSGQLVQSDIQSADFSNWQLIEPADVKLQPNQIFIDNFCLLSLQNAKACNQLDSRDGNYKFVSVLDKIPLELINPWIPDDVETSGTLTSSIELTGQFDALPKGSIDVTLINGQALYLPQNRQPLSYPYDQIDLNIELSNEQTKASLVAQLSNGDNADIRAILPQLPDWSFEGLDQLPIKAEAKINLSKLELFETLTPELQQVKGQLRSDIQLSGSLAQPELTGSANLTNASFNITEFDVPLHSVNMDIQTLTSQSIEYTMDGFIESGKIQLEGKTQLNEALGWPSDIRFVTQQINLYPYVKKWLPVDTVQNGLFDSESTVEIAWPSKLFVKSAISSHSGDVNFAVNGITESLSYDQFQLDIDIGQTGLTSIATVALSDGSKANATYEFPINNILDLELENQSATGKGHIEWNNLALIDRQIEPLSDLTGSVTADWELRGRMNQPDILIDARLDNSSFSLPEYNQHFINTQIFLKSIDSKKARFTGTSDLAQGQLEVTGEALIDVTKNWKSQFEIAASELDSALLLQTWLPVDLDINGKINASANLQFEAPDVLLGKVVLSSDNGVIDYPLPSGEIEHWDYKNARVEFQLADDKISADSQFLFGADSRFSLQATLPNAKLLTLAPETQPLSASTRINFHEIELLELLIPEADNIAGKLLVNIDAAGTLAKPSLNGNIDIENASFNIPRIGLTIEDVNFKGRTQGNNIFRFEGNAKSDEGTVTVSGESLLDAAKNWPTKLKINGNNFQVSQIPEAAVRISPELDVSIEGRHINVGGKIIVPYAKLQPRDVTSAVRVSEDTVVIGGIEQAESAWAITSDTEIILGNRVNFFGFGFEGQLGGRLKVLEEPGQLTRGVGEISVVSGRYRAYGQYLDIENGRIIFTGGPINNPGLDVRAIRVSNAVTTGIHVRGRLNNPQLELFSQPAMGQTDILAYLLLGGPIDSASGEDGELMAKAALALGLAGGDKLARSIGDKFGFDEMRIESSEGGDQASMVVGRYLSPKLYVSYGVGLIESFNSLNLRYQISDRWQLKAESGENHGADVLYVIER